MSKAPQPRLDAEYINGIGSLVFACSELESLVVDLIAAFSQTDIVSTIILAGHMQAKSKTDCLLALMRLKIGKDDEFSPIFDTIKKIQNISEFRNNLVHSYWSIDNDGTVKTIKFSARGEFKRSRREITSQEILAHADEAFSLLPILRSLRDHFQDNAKTAHFQDQ